jgi:hypothetical protein
VAQWLYEKRIMSNQKLLEEIQNLPVVEQREILEVLSRNVGHRSASTAQPMPEAQFEQMLLEKAIIDEIPSAINDEEEPFEPVVVQGKPLSETIIEERR